MSRMIRKNVPSRIERPWTRHTHLGTGAIIAELNGGHREYRRITCRPRYAAAARCWIMALPVHTRSPRWLDIRSRGL